MSQQTELSGEEQINKALTDLASLKKQPEEIVKEVPSEDTDDVIVVDEKPEEDTDKNKLNDVEKEAYEMGWRPKDEFVKSGHDADSWTSARAYISFRNLQRANKDLQDRVSTIEEDSAKKFENLGNFYKSKNDFDIKKLKEEMMSAVSNADTDEYTRLHGEIEKLENEGKVFSEPVVQKKVQQPAQNQLPPIVQDFIKRNDFMNDPSDSRAVTANALWDSFIKRRESQGLKTTNEDALKHTESELKKLGIIEGEKVNPMRTNAAAVETGRSPVKKTGQNVVSMATIPNEIRSFWEATKDTPMWKNKDGTYRTKEFLQSYADSKNQRR